MKNNSNVKLDDSTYSSTSDSAKNVADIWKEYYENGQVKSETPMVNGDVHGNKKWYYENGQLKCEIPFVNGKINGTWKEYYETGELKTETQYVLSKAHGIEKWYYENGQLKEESLYVDGELMGTNNYDEKWQIITECLFNIGKY